MCVCVSVFKQWRFDDLSRKRSSSYSTLGSKSTETDQGKRWFLSKATTQLGPVTIGPSVEKVTFSWSSLQHVPSVATSRPLLYLKTYPHNPYAACYSTVTLYLPMYVQIPTASWMALRTCRNGHGGRHWRRQASFLHSESVPLRYVIILFITQWICSFVTKTVRVFATQWESYCFEKAHYDDTTQKSIAEYELRKRAFSSWGPDSNPHFEWMSCAGRAPFTHVLNSILLCLVYVMNALTGLCWAMIAQLFTVWSAIWMNEMV